MRSFFAATLFLFAAGAAHAETFPVITDATVLKECGDCHMAFPPETLPKATWEKIIGDLSHHFGEDATLDSATVAQVLAFHVNNAADVSTSRAATRWNATPAPTRIIDAPRFIKKHGTCSDAVWAHPKVQSKSNCVACHTTMQKNGSTEASLRFLPADVRKGCGDD